MAPWPRSHLACRLMPPAIRFTLLAVLVVVAALPASANAADATVTISGKAFGPTAVTVDPGSSVTWNWAGGTHNVHVTAGPETFDSGFKSAGGTYTRALTAPGTYRYQCDPHPDMQASVTVGAAAAGTPAPAAAPGPDLAPPRLRSVSVSRLAVVRATVSQPGTLSIRLLRGGRTLRRATAPLAAGVNRIPLAVRGLRRGSYRVRLEARDAHGRRSAPVERTVLVTRA